MPEIVWKSGAEGDLLQVFSSLEDVREGAGVSFTTKLDALLQHLRDFPSLGPMFEPPMRRLLVEKSGFGLFYTVEKRGIIVHALIRLSSDPNAIRRKLRGLLELE